MRNFKFTLVLIIFLVFLSQCKVNKIGNKYKADIDNTSSVKKQVIMHSDSLKIKSNEMSIKEIVDSIDCKQCTLKDLLSNRTLANYKEVHWIDERPLVLSYICLKYSDSNYVHIFFDELKYNKRTTTTYSWKLSDFYPEIVSDFKYSKSFYRR